MIPTEVGSVEWLAASLSEARLIESMASDRLVQAFREDSPFGDAKALADYLTQMGLLTSYQARRALEGDAKKLVVGPYNLVDAIPSRTFGAVYKAIGRADRKHYILKILPQRNNWKVRLAREQITLIEKIQNQPGMVPFIDVGTSNNQHYLVWPFVEGQTLESVVREKGPMATPQIARIAIQILELLRHCKKNRLAHGMIKPTNIMLGFDGQVRLLDFGIGAIVAENQDEIESMIDTVSMAEATASMLECASPELVLDPTKLTSLGDQYSLGCTLYFTAAGRYPFPGGTMMEKVLWHQKAKPEPIYMINPDVAKKVISLIDQMMSKSPGDRFQSLGDLIEAFEPFTQGKKNVYTSSVPVDIQTPLPRRSQAVIDLGNHPPTALPPPVAEAVPVEITKPKGRLSRWFFG